MFIAVMTYVCMLAFGVLHAHLHGVPAFGYFESLALVVLVRLLRLTVRDD
jgi:hypothetical protein